MLIFKKHVFKGHPVSSWVLQAPDTTKWIVLVTAEGVLKAYSGAAGAVGDFKVSKSGGGEASFAITNDGELQVKDGGDLSGSASLNDDFRLRAIGGTIYKLNVTADSEIQLETV